MASMFNRTIGGFLNQPAKPARAENEVVRPTQHASAVGTSTGPASAPAAGGAPVGDGARTVRQRARLPVGNVSPVTAVPAVVTLPNSDASAGSSGGTGAAAGAGSGSDAPGAQDSITLGQLKAAGPPPVQKQKVRALQLDRLKRRSARYKLNNADSAI